MVYDEHSPIMQFIDRYFASLGEHVRITGLRMKDGWAEMANGDAPLNRMFSIALGYTVFGVMLAVYLNVLTVGSVQSAGRAVRNAIRQQLIVLKVRFYIIFLCQVNPSVRSPRLSSSSWSFSLWAVG